MTAAFQPSREDGRSDRQVIVDLVAAGEPGSTYGYPALIEALSEGLDARPPRSRVYRAIATANRTLLRERSRYLGVVRGSGYRMLRADEHLPVALRDKDTAEGYIRRGIEKLRHTRLDELPENLRELHEGQLMVMVGLHQAVRSQAARQNRQDRVLDDLLKRVERIEGGAS